MINLENLILQPLDGQVAPLSVVDQETDPRTVYTTRCDEFAKQRDHYDQRWNRTANLRLGLFLLAFVLVGVAIWQNIPLLFVLAAGAFLGFVAAVVQHRRLGRTRQRYAELWALNDEGLKRLDRAWAVLPLRQAVGAAKAETPPFNYAPDLDILGHASLQHLLNTAYTPGGRSLLQRWLNQPASPPTILARQGAVGELAPLIDFRDELALRGRLMGDVKADYEPFLRWATGPTFLLQRPWLVWLSRLLPLLLLGSFVAYSTRLITFPLWLIFLVVQLGLVLTLGAQADEIIEQVSARQGVFGRYAELFGLLTQQPFASSALERLQAELTVDGLRADQQMHRFGRIMALSDLRLWMFYFPVKLTTLWNFHVLFLLERWQRVAGSRARAWLAALSEAEALSALATLKHDQPTWTFPQINRTPLLFATGIGHPLLADDVRVTNDVRIGPTPTFLLITGSNMSGKSTLLRAVGVNVVLAQAGGPVCATEMRLPPTALATSVRVQDSLEQGVSYFMAELLRLKEVVDTARRVRSAGDQVVLFLLDEILHGTNTTERQIAARQIIRQLLDLGAIGAVSTHDLALADSPEIGDDARAVHFTESFSRGPDGPQMQFDYKLRPGIAQSTNALKLMEIVGLDIEPVTT